MTIAGTTVDASHGRAATLPALLASAENPRASADAWSYWPGSHDALLPLRPRLPTSRNGMNDKLLRYSFRSKQIIGLAHAVQQPSAVTVPTALRKRNLMAENAAIWNSPVVARRGSAKVRRLSLHEFSGLRENRGRQACSCNTFLKIPDAGRAIDPGANTGYFSTMAERL